METCGESCIKYILFIFNLIFTISGIGLIAAGAIVLLDIGRFSHIVEARIIAPPIVLTVVGVVVFIVAFLGCCGAIRESYCLLITFAVCLLMIFIAELAVGVAVAVFRNDFETALKETLRESMKNYGFNKTDQTTWDNLQSKLECCGVESPHDWPYSQRPLSCCHVIQEDGIETHPERYHCINAQVGDKILYPYGCYQKLQMNVEESSKILIGMGIGIAFVEVIGIILACCLAFAIKKRESKEETPS